MIKSEKALRQAMLCRMLHACERSSVYTCSREETVTFRLRTVRVLSLVGGRGLSLGARRRVLLEQREARRLGLGGDVDRGELEQHLAPQRLALVRVRVRVRVRVELGLGLG